MQELLFPEFSVQETGSFDGYRCFHHVLVEGSDPPTTVCLFSKQDANGKRLYLVGERIPYEGGFRLINVREFRHARNRAFRYYEKRREDLAR